MGGEVTTLDPPASDETLVVGAATVDITPTDLKRTFLAGFATNRRPLGVMDRLEAGALYLSQGDRELVLVSLDLIGLLRPWVQAIRQRVKTVADKAAIICCSTHTHSGPDTLGIWGRGILGVVPFQSGLNRDYMETLVDRVAGMIDKARARAVPAALRAATFEVPAHWTRNDRRAGGRDDQAHALAFDDVHGRRIATVLNYASHPETLWERNRWISADFPGPLRSRIRALAGGEALYFSGPLGAMLTPNVNPRARLGERMEYVERMGRALADLCTDRVATAPLVTPTDLTHRHSTIELVNQNWRFKIMSRAGVLGLTLEPGGRLTTEIHSVVLGDVHILTVPGEPAPEVGQRMRALLDGPHRWVLSLGCDELGYILEPAMFSDREYAYEQTMSLGPATVPALESAYAALLRP